MSSILTTSFASFVSSSTSRIAFFSLRSMSTITLPKQDRSHHVGSPTTHFRNPWPSYKDHGMLDLLHTRFRGDRNFVPIPTDRKELVNVRQANFTYDEASAKKLKATWLGHASWLIEYPSSTSDRGIRVLLDPVFAERTSPVKFLGPKRYSPLPCTLQDIPAVDAVLISHNHYDHLDINAITEIHRQSPNAVFLCALNNKDWFHSAGVSPEKVFEFDWWDAASLTVDGVGSLSIVCTPAQHASARTPFDKDRMLWCGWAIGNGLESVEKSSTAEVITVARLDSNEIPFSSPRLFFAGDTGYRAVPSPRPTEEEENTSPRCPAFAQIGGCLGPFDLALIPIGLYSPRDMLSSVHCSPEDSVCVHQDVRSKRTLGMHWGTFRGGISGQYEDVREPPRRFEASAKKAGLAWDEEIGLCDIGETVVV